MLSDEAKKGNAVIVSEVKKIFARKIIPMLRGEEGKRTAQYNPEADVEGATKIFVHFFAQGIDRNSIFNHPEDEDKILQFLSELWYSSLDLEDEYDTHQIEQALIAYRLPRFLIDHGIARLLPDLYRVLQTSQEKSDTLHWSGWRYIPIEQSVGIPFFNSKHHAECLEERLSADPDLFFQDCHKILELAGSLLNSGPDGFISRGVIALVAKTMFFRKQVMTHVWRVECAHIFGE